MLETCHIGAQDNREGFSNENLSLKIDLREIFKITNSILL